MKQHTSPRLFRQIALLVLLLLLIACPSRLLAQKLVSEELGKIKELYDKTEPIVWVITGNSITHGNFLTHGYRSYAEHFAERTRSEMARFRDVVINTGVAGDTVPKLTNDLDHRVLRFKPTVVSIMMGMNDSAAGPEGREKFRASYFKLVNRLKSESDSLILLHTPNPITSTAVRRSDLPAYAQIVREVAQDRGVSLCDQDKMWREHLELSKSNLIYLIGDGTIHPNRWGMCSSHTISARP
ncbi:MAG: GDSL-type esterase/lipase family protein [Pirellulales bacterium]